MSALLDLDTALFLFVNRTLACPFTDWAMPLVTNGRHWVVPVAAAILFMYVRAWRKALWVTGGTVLVVALCDQSSAHWLKPLFERVRPCHAVDGARVLIHCTQAYSFPSAHAANTFGAALWFSYGFPRLAWVFYPLAVLVSISRVFVGVHYPFDIVGGALLGTGIAAVGVVIARTVRRRLSSEESRRED